MMNDFSVDGNITRRVGVKTAVERVDTNQKKIRERFNELSSHLNAVTDNKSKPEQLKTAVQNLAAYLQKNANQPTIPQKSTTGQEKAYLPRRSAPAERIASIYNSSIHNPLRLAAANDVIGNWLTGLDGQATSGPANENDLKATPEIVIDDEIRALASSLDNTPIKIYEYMRNSFAYEPYWGSQKGAKRTLLEKAGNDVDLASLTMALLRASGIHCRYVMGTIEMPIADAGKWIGVDDPTQIAKTFQSNGIPFETTTSGGKIANIKLNHTWVNAYVDYFPYHGARNEAPNTWIEIDPSFKQNTFTTKTDLQVKASSRINEINNSRSFLLDSGLTGFQQVLEETSETGGNAVKSYVIGDDVISQNVAGESQYLIYDGHGSTRLLCSNTSTIVDSYDYDAYGIMIGKESNSSNQTLTDLLYAGEHYDTDLQMQYLRARYYDQNSGRFSQVDQYSGSLYDPQSLHKYAYVHCDPVNNVDPSGQYLIEILAVVSIQMTCYTMVGGAVANKATGGALYNGLFMTMCFLMEPSVWYTGVMSIFTGICQFFENLDGLVEMLCSILVNILTGGLLSLFTNITNAINSTATMIRFLSDAFSDTNASDVIVTTLKAYTVALVIVMIVLSRIVQQIVAAIARVVTQVINKIVSWVVNKVQSIYAMSPATVGAPLPSGNSSAASTSSAGTSEVTSSDTTLYRSVSDQEFQSLMKDKAFSNPPGINGKYFSTDYLGAKQEHEFFDVRATSPGAVAGRPYHIVKTTFPKDMISEEMIHGVDSKVTAILVPSEMLQYLSEAIEIK